MLCFVLLWLNNQLLQVQIICKPTFFKVIYLLMFNHCKQAYFNNPEGKVSLWGGVWFIIQMPFYQYEKFHYGDEAVWWQYNLHNGIFYTGRMTSLYWIRGTWLSLCRGGWGKAPMLRTSAYFGHLLHSTLKILSQYSRAWFILDHI